MTLRLNGSSSGFTEVKAPAAAGDNTITLPTSNGSANQFNEFWDGWRAGVRGTCVLRHADRNVLFRSKDTIKTVTPFHQALMVLSM